MAKLSSLILAGAVFFGTALIASAEPRKIGEEMPVLNNYEHINSNLVFYTDNPEKIYLETRFGKNKVDFMAAYRICNKGRVDNLPFAIYDYNEKVLYLSFDGRRVGEIIQKAIPNEERIYLNVPNCGDKNET